jgi:hypothetical protein
LLKPAEADWIRTTFANGKPQSDSPISRVETQDFASPASWLETHPDQNIGAGQFASPILSVDGQAVYSLLAAWDESEAENALHCLPANMQARLTAMSPMNYLDGMQAPLVVLLHDRGDSVIPVAESQFLNTALTGRAGLHYTEMQFHHLDPAKGKLPLFRLIGELSKFFRAIYPMFQQVVKS